MSIPNFEHQYDALEGLENDERYQRLCTMQMREASVMSSRHAQQRVMLAASIRRTERQAALDAVDADNRKGNV